MLETIKIILNLLPVVIQVIRQLEDLFPESGQGKMKFQLVIQAIQTTQVVGTNMLPIVEKLVDVVVGIFNQFGIFKKV